jgi:hypothetical protein
VLSLLTEFLFALLSWGTIAPLAFQFSMGCCCGTCEICSDDWTGIADGTDISTGTSCGWTESSGSWDVTSNQVRCTSAGIAICNTAHPDSATTMVVEVDFKHDTSASSCDVLVTLSDSTHYVYARYKVGSNTIDIRYKSGATDASIGSTSATLNTNTTYTAKVCVSANGFVTAWLDGVPKITKDASARIPATGYQAGLGASGSGTATFDNWTFSKAFDATDEPTCEDCVSTCTGCATGTDGSYEIEVTLSANWIDLGCGSGACNARASGTFLLPYTSDCNWGMSLGTVCFGWTASISARIAGGLIIVDVVTTDTFNLRQSEFRYSSGGSSINCDSISGVNAPLFSDGGTGVCDATNVTCTVSIVPA